MTELSDLQVVSETSAPFRTARVISVSGQWLTVDFGSGTNGTVVQSTDSCNPIPDQTVFIAKDGRRWVAVGALGGPYRQATMIATGSSSTTATGVVNGVSKAVTKMGSFTVTNGDELPLIWSADGSEVWVAAKAGVAYVPPSGGGSGTGGGTTPGSYTTSYAATSSGTHYSSGFNSSGDLKYLGSDVLQGAQYGYFGYGSNRFHELASRTIISGRIYLPLTAGGGSPHLTVGSGPSFSTVALGGWASLSSTRIGELVSASGQTTIRLSSVGGWQVRGIPGGGTVQITWK